MFVHAMLFFYPYLADLHFGLNRSSDNDVLSRHKGGKVPQVHLHLGDDAEKPAGTLYVHLRWSNTPTSVTQPSGNKSHSGLTSHPASQAQHPVAHRHHHQSQMARDTHPDTIKTAQKVITTQPLPPPVTTAASNTALASSLMPAAASSNSLLAASLTALSASNTAPTTSGVPAPAKIAETKSTAPDTVIKAPASDDHEFPHDLVALYRINVGLALPVGVDAEEHWHIDGRRYTLDLNAHKFGFHAEIISTGRISEQGLLPDSFEVLLNHKPRIDARFSYTDHTLVQGHAGQEKSMVFVDGTQDMFSFAYDLALVFSGHEHMDMTVSNGTSLYDLQFHLLGEELLQLPAGRIRTFHLQGARQMMGDSHIQTGYDAWLAPDLNNLPVKMAGPDSSGRRFEMVLKSLQMDGKRVLESAPLNDTSAESIQPAGLPSSVAPERPSP